jgi:hypothetical protein
MKDIIIGAADKYNISQIRCWINSIKASGFAGDILLISYRLDDEVLAYAAQKGVQVYQCDQTPWASAIDHNARGRDTQSHQLRFFHSWVILKGLKASDYRYVVMTDVRDVVFQTNPSEWLYSHFYYEPGKMSMPEHTIIASSENITYENEQWGLENIYNGFGPYITHELKKQPIANVGTIAGEFESMKNLSLILYLMGENRYIPNDQSSFNILARTLLATDIKVLPHIDGWACQVGTTLDESKSYLWLNNIDARPIFNPLTKNVCSPLSASPYCIVHQYDRNPELKKHFEEMFKD